MEQRLDKAGAGRVVVARITGNENVWEKLKKYGIEENTAITVVGKISFGGSIISVDGKNFVLTKTLAENIILVK